MLQFILPALIFLSLGVIIFFVARYYPQLRENNKEKTLEINQKNKAIRNKIFSLFFSIWGAAKDFLVLITEKTIKKIKELLHLVHFWIIKIKKKKENGKALSEEDKFLGEIEAKEELLKQEEEDLKKVLHDDLGSSEQDELVREVRKKMQEREIEKELFVKEEEQSETGFFEKEVKVDKEELNIPKDKLAGFLEGKSNGETNCNYNQTENEELMEYDLQFGKENLPEDVSQKKEKTSAVKKILNTPKNIFGKLFSKKDKKDIYRNDEEVAGDYHEDEFSDGIVKIEEYKKSPTEESLLIKEVIRVEKEKDLDEEMGVDRQILEKKLINKIVRNPKQAENYRQLGELYIKMGSYSEANECYQQILKLYTRDADAKRKLEKIKLLKRIKK